MVSKVLKDGDRRDAYPTENSPEEVTELVGQCLWDVFSDNHDVIAFGGRIADSGSFRSASAFLDEQLGSQCGTAVCGDEHRFYMGTI